MENESKYDVAIVGGGLGGLTAGATLAKAGKKVILVEQHRIVGGAATIFNRKHRVFEVGLHEMTLGSARTKRFKEIGIWDKVEFIKVPEFYRLRKGEIDVVIPDDFDQAKKNLYKVFPNEKEAIDQFYKDMLDIRMQGYQITRPLGQMLKSLPLLPFRIRKLIKYRNTNLGEYLDKLTENEDLKFVLMGNIGYYHHEPYTLSMLLFMLGQGSYMSGGGWFVKGGSQHLSNAFAEIIEENGGKVVVRNMVREIIVKNKTAVGIRYSSKKGKDKTLYTVKADHVVLNAPLTTVADKLIPSLKHSKMEEKLNNLELPPSLFTIYFSFKQPVTDLFDGRYSTFFYDDVGTLPEFTDMENSDDYSKKGYVFVDYNSIDSGICQEGSYIGSLCGISFMKHWENLDEEEYESKKEDVIESYVDRLNKRLPGFKERIEHVEMSTPKTIQRYTQNPDGVIYGFAQTPKQALRNKAKTIQKEIKNLYVSNAYVRVGGFSGTISTGFGVAKKILKKYK